MKRSKRLRRWAEALRIARRALIITAIALVVFIVMLMLRWRPAWDLLFGTAYWLDGYGAYGGNGS